MLFLISFVINSESTVLLSKTQNKTCSCHLPKQRATHKPHMTDSAKDKSFTCWHLGVSRAVPSHMVYLWTTVNRLRNSLLVRKKQQLLRKTLFLFKHLKHLLLSALLFFFLFMEVFYMLVSSWTGSLRFTLLLGVVTVWAVNTSCRWFKDTISNLKCREELF